MARLPKFRLVTMLLVITMLAMALGWWQDWQRRQSTLYLHVFRKDTTEPQCVATILVPSHGEFDVQFREDYRNLSGRVTCSATGAYELDLNGGFHSGVSHSGPIELETMTSSNGIVWFTGPIIYGYVFALSRNKDSQLLLGK